MKYISLDIETTGNNPDEDQVLSIAAVLEDTAQNIPLDKLPYIHIVINHERIKGTPGALAMNMDLIEFLEKFQSSTIEERQRIEDDHNVVVTDEHNAVQIFYYWLGSIGIVNVNQAMNQYVTKFRGDVVPAINVRSEPAEFTAAGKNFGTFDLQFLKKLPQWNNLIKVNSRVIDPAILYWDPESDISMPSFRECKERALLTKTEYSHDALIDARETIELIRRAFLK